MRAQITTMNLGRFKLPSVVWSPEKMTSAMISVEDGSQKIAPGFPRRRAARTSAMFQNGGLATSVNSGKRQKIPPWFPGGSATSVQPKGRDADNLLAVVSLPAAHVHTVFTDANKLMVPPGLWGSQSWATAKRVAHVSAKIDKVFVGLRQFIPFPNRSTKSRRISSAIFTLRFAKSI